MRKILVGLLLLFASSAEAKIQLQQMVNELPISPATINCDSTNKLEFDGSDNTAVLDCGNSRWGFGTASPLYGLDVAVGARFTGQTIHTASATFFHPDFSIGIATFAVTGGLVGILDASPDYPLDVNGALRAIGQAIFSSSVTFKYPDFSVGIATFAVTGGQVGVLTASPAYPLDVNGAARIQGQTIASGSATFQNNAFSIGGSTFVVDSGYIGLGLSNPVYQLDVLGTISPAASAVTRNVNITNTIASIGANGVHFNVYSNAISNDITDNTGNTAHFGSAVFRSSDTHPGRTDSITLEARGDFRSTTTALSHIAFLAYADAVIPNAVSRASHTAVVIRPCITTDGDCTTHVNQGVIKGLWIEAVKGGETDDSRHQIYVNPSPGFNYFGSQVSIGSLSPTESYGLFVGTQVWFTSLEAHAGPMYVQNQGAPAGIAGFAVFYSTTISGTTEMMVKDGGGANTQLSSHDPDGKWIHSSFYDEGRHAGKSLYIPMEELVADLEKFTGKRYIFSNRDEYLKHPRVTGGQDSKHDLSKPGGYRQRGRGE